MIDFNDIDIDETPSIVGATIRAIGYTDSYYKDNDIWKHAKSYFNGVYEITDVRIKTDRLYRLLAVSGVGVSTTVWHDISKLKYEILIL